LNSAVIAGQARNDKMILSLFSSKNSEKIPIFALKKSFDNKQKD
jgi:hypothetical protein